MHPDALGPFLGAPERRARLARYGRGTEHISKMPASWDGLRGDWYTRKPRREALLCAKRSLDKVEGLSIVRHFSVTERYTDTVEIFRSLAFSQDDAEGSVH